MPHRGKFWLKCVQNFWERNLENVRNERFSRHTASFDDRLTLTSSDWCSFQLDGLPPMMSWRKCWSLETRPFSLKGFVFSLLNALRLLISNLWPQALLPGSLLCQHICWAYCGATWCLHNFAGAMVGPHCANSFHLWRSVVSVMWRLGHLTVLMWGYSNVLYKFVHTCSCNASSDFGTVPVNVLLSFLSSSFSY